MKTLIIADIGSTHQGSFNTAQNLVAAAASSGAGAVKFQYWSDPIQLAARRRVDDPAVYQRYPMPAEWLAKLAEQAHKLGMRFMCTAFLPQDVLTVAAHVDVFKLAAFEANAEDMLRTYDKLLAHDLNVGFRRDLIVSMGLGALDEIVQLEIDPDRSGSIKYLQCVSAYPAPVDDLNLRLVLNGYDGLSDHTSPDYTWTGALAVAAGGTIVEAHLRLESTAKNNPDYPHSMTPQQFYEYVRHIHFAERAMGAGRMGPQPSELPNVKHMVTRA